MRSAEGSQDDGSALQSAWIAAARGEAEAALDALQPLLSRRPDDAEALDLAISMLEDAGRHDALCGLLAHLAGLTASSQPVAPEELAADFDWERVRPADRVVGWSGAALMASPGA